VTALFVSRALGVVGGDFSDPTNERLILLSAAGLALVGVALLVGTILWWRRGRQEHPALAPLEVMGSRAWTKAPEGERRRRIDRVRIGGPAPSPDEQGHLEPVDLEALVRSVPQAFDDLREPSVAEDQDLAWLAALDLNGVAVGAGDGSAAVDVAAVGPVAAAPIEAAAPAVVNDPDATSVSAERPLIEPADEKSPADEKKPGPTHDKAAAQALASSHGDPA
jgi:hypothetical protein